MKKVNNFIYCLVNEEFISFKKILIDKEIKTNLKEEVFLYELNKNDNFENMLLEIQQKISENN